MTVFDEFILFLIANWLNIFIIVAFIFLCVWCYKNNKKKVVYFWLLHIVNEVEERYGNDGADIKYSIILDRIYHVLPSVVRFMFSIKELDDMITKAIDTVQDMLENGIEDKK